MLLITSTANIKTWERDNGLYGGLSPLARGTRQNGLSSLVRLRFIPAGAGNTCFRKSMDYCYSVYPRWRGEHGRTEYKAVYLLGLSPLARGTLALQQQHPWPRRFIPAGAGNTKCWWALMPQTQVYPRWRGEHITPFCDCPVFAGLSPLARGTQGINQFTKNVRRFIPAGAGNTKKPPSASNKNSVYPRWRGEHSKHNLLLINDFLSQSQSTNFIVSHKQHIHYVKEHLIHWLKR